MKRTGNVWVTASMYTRVWLFVYVCMRPSAWSSVCRARDQRLLIAFFLISSTEEEAPATVTVK